MTQANSVHALTLAAGRDITQIENFISNITGIDSGTRARMAHKRDSLSGTRGQVNLKAFLKHTRRNKSG